LPIAIIQPPPNSPKKKCLQQDRGIGEGMTVADGGLEVTYCKHTGNPSELHSDFFCGHALLCVIEEYIHTYSSQCLP
jgi:hypothetical protein